MTLVGMVLGMALVRVAASWRSLVWAAFLALTALHVYANVRAMRCLHMTSLNAARLGMLLRRYLCTVRGRLGCLPARLGGCGGLIRWGLDWPAEQQGHVCEWACGVLYM